MTLGHFAFVEGGVVYVDDQLEAAFQLFVHLWQGAAAMPRGIQAQVAAVRSQPAEAGQRVADAIRLAEKPDAALAIAWALVGEARGPDSTATPTAPRTSSMRSSSSHRERVVSSSWATPRRPRGGSRRPGALRRRGAACSAPRARSPRHHRLPALPSASRIPGGVHHAAPGRARDGRVESAWAAGAAWSSMTPSPTPVADRGQRERPLHGWDSLTPTELQVVELVASGLTNPQIGEQMFISKRTVQTHVAYVFTKLGVSTRSAVAAKATGRDRPTQSDRSRMKAVATRVRHPP